MNDSSVIGVRRPRIDSEVKVRGALRYAADEPIPTTAANQVSTFQGVFF